MKLRIALSTLLLSGLLLTGCTGMEQQPEKAAAQPADPAAKVEALIAAADAAREKAGSVGGEWRDTGKILAKAKKAAAAGDYAKAEKLARQAQREGELGYEQAMAQQQLVIPSYFKK